MSEIPALKQIIEGAILAADQPLSIDLMIHLFEHEPPTRAEVREALATITEECDGKGFELKEVASGYRFQVKTEYGQWVSRLWDERPPRYTRALLETLALIAYKQPITRGDIEEIRGVAFSSNTLEILLELNWVKPDGRKDVPGKPIQYATTENFLNHFNIQKLSDLPTIDELGSAGLIDTSSVNSSIFGTSKFFSEQSSKTKEDIYSDIENVLDDNEKLTE